MTFHNLIAASGTRARKRGGNKWPLGFRVASANGMALLRGSRAINRMLSAGTRQNTRRVLRGC